MPDQDTFRKNFIDRLIGVLDGANDLRQKLVRKDTASRLDGAWPPVRKALGQIGEEIASDWSDHEADLSAVGLKDLEHNWKLQEFLDSAERWGKDHDRRSLRSVLGWALLILGSLGNVFLKLSHIIDFVKEFLEGWKQGLEDAEGGR